MSNAHDPHDDKDTGYDTTFTCEQCGETYARTTPPEEVLAEYEATFSLTERNQEGGRVELCDSCYDAFMVWLAAHPELRLT